MTNEESCGFQWEASTCGCPKRSETDKNDERKCQCDRSRTISIRLHQRELYATYAGTYPSLKAGTQEICFKSYLSFVPGDEASYPQCQEIKRFVRIAGSRRHHSLCTPVRSAPREIRRWAGFAVTYIYYPSIPFFLGSQGPVADSNLGNKMREAVGIWRWGLRRGGTVYGTQLF